MGRTVLGLLQAVGTIAATAIGTAIGGPVGGAIAAALFNIGFTLAVGRPGPPKPETVQTAIKTSRPPRVSGYGRGRLYGAYVLFETAPNGTAVDVYAVHDGKIDGVEARYLGDEQIALFASVVQQGADGRYRDGAINLYETDGSVPGAGFPAVEALLPSDVWGPDHRGDGVVAMALTAKSVRAKVFQETYPSASVPVPSLVARWQLCPDPAAVDPLDESGWTWTENSVRHLLHYKLVREGPRPGLPRSDPGYDAALAALRAEWWARRIAPTLSFWIAAAADCDLPVELAAGGTEPRYRSSVTHRHTDEHKGPVAAILATFDGWISPRSDGALVVYSGRYYAPDPVADLIGPDEIISYTWEGGDVDDDRAVNEYVCGYISAQHDYNSVECEAWRDEADISRRGRVLSASLDLAVPSHSQIRRLAKREMARALAVNRGTVTTNLAGRHARGKRYIWLRLAEAGAVFFDGPAEIIAASRSVRGGVSFEWVAADINVDEWNPATEEGEPAALGNRVAGVQPEAPTVTSATIAYETATTGGTGARVSIVAAGPDRSDLTWFARWRQVGSASWNEQEYPDLDSGPSATMLTGLVPVESDIEVQVAYALGDGRVSPWSDPPAEVETDTETTPPDDAVSITLLNWSDVLNLSTPGIPRASSYRWRFYESDGTTLIRTINTADRTVAYTSALARADGARRAYVVDVAGVNSAGAGGEVASALLELDAPPAPTGLTIPDDPDTAVATFTPVPPGNGVTGYAFYYSNVSGFDPSTTGFVVYAGDSPIYAYALAVDTFYGKVAAFDAWSRDPSLLNFTGEETFDITAGGGAGGGGGAGPGGGGGGFEVDRL